MNWYKKAQYKVEDEETHPSPALSDRGYSVIETTEIVKKKVRAEYWEAVGNWVLVPADKPRDRNLRPMGKAYERGIGINIFEFSNKEDAENFAVEKGWEVVNELV